jgi:hypothetical protein
MIFLLLLSNLTFAEHTTLKAFPSSWGSEELCKQLGGEECFEIIGNIERYSPKVIQVDGEPIYSKTDVKLCLDAEDCQAKLKAQICDQNEQAIKNIDLLEVYCTKVIGHKQVDKTILAVDEAKDAIYQAKLQQKAIDEAKEKAIQVKIKEIEKGQKLIAMIRVSSDMKNLSVEQKKALILSTKEIIEALSIGSLDVAKSLIQAIQPDGVMITAQDKSSILGEL